MLLFIYNRLEAFCNTQKIAFALQVYQKGA